MIKKSDTQKNLEKFKKQYEKLLEKFPTIMVCSDIKENLIAIEISDVRQKVYIKPSHGS